MKGYLLDTSICVFLFREHREVTQKLNAIGFHRCFITDVVLAELRYGAFKSDYVEDNLKLIDDFVQKVQVLPFADSIDEYAQEKVRLKNAGTPIEEFDLLIGVTAVAEDMIMVTENVKDFQNIQDIQIENWIERDK